MLALNTAGLIFLAIPTLRPSELHTQRPPRHNKAEAMMSRRGCCQHYLHTAAPSHVHVGSIRYGSCVVTHQGAKGRLVVHKSSLHVVSHPQSRHCCSNVARDRVAICPSALLGDEEGENAGMRELMSMSQQHVRGSAYTAGSAALARRDEPVEAIDYQHDACIAWQPAVARTISHCCHDKANANHSSTRPVLTYRSRCTAAARSLAVPLPSQSTKSAAWNTTARSRHSVTLSRLSGARMLWAWCDGFFF